MKTIAKGREDDVRPVEPSKRRSGLQATAQGPREHERGLLRGAVAANPPPNCPRKRGNCTLRLGEALKNKTGLQLVLLGDLSETTPADYNRSLKRTDSGGGLSHAEG